MTTVTVCVPAYRSGPVIAQALASLRGQSHAKIRVFIAVDPPAAETLEFVEPFLADARFEVSVNPERLGWDGNVRSLLGRVATPAFAILPQDDLLHLRAVETLLERLQAFPAASVAYGDMHLFGAGAAIRKTVDLPAGGTRAEQMLAFFLAGAEAVPWRGVTRTEVVERSGGFPVDGFQGFAVECEWALRLLLHGPAIRVPRRLYFKRIWPAGVLTASRARVVGQSPEALRAAWERHREKMLSMVAEAMPEDAPQLWLVEAAAEAAMLGRLRSLAGLDLSEGQCRQALALAELTERRGASDPVAAAVATRLRSLAAAGAPETR